MVMNSLPFKGVRRIEEKVRWTFSPPNGCNDILHPGRAYRVEMVFFHIGQATHPPPNLPLYALGY
jgi:hypothetical protein